MNVDAATLKATIDSYNALCDKQKDTEYGKNSKYLEKVETGSYNALTAFPLQSVLLVDFLLMKIHRY